LRVHKSRKVLIKQIKFILLSKSLTGEDYVDIRENEITSKSRRTRITRVLIMAVGSIQQRIPGGAINGSAASTPDPSRANPVRRADEFVPTGGFASINGSKFDVDSNLNRAGVRVVQAAIRAAQASQGGNGVNPGIASKEAASAVEDIRKTIVTADLSNPLTTVRDGGISQGLTNVGTRFNSFAATIGSVQGGGREGQTIAAQSITNVIQAITENPEQFLTTVTESTPELQGNSDLGNQEFKKQVLEYLSLIVPGLRQLQSSLQFGIQSSKALGDENKTALQGLKFSSNSGGNNGGSP
jgi:hypothetical protein